MAPTTAQSTSAKRAMRASSYAKQEDQSETSAVDELKKLVEGNAASLKQIGEVLKGVDDRTTASLSQMKELLKTVGDRSETSTREQLKQNEEAVKAIGDKVQASTQEQLKQMKELFKANEDHMMKLQTSMSETAQNSKVLPAKPKSVTQQGMVTFPFKISDLQKIRNKELKSKKVEIMGVHWYISVVEKNLQSGDYLGVFLHCVPNGEEESYTANFTVQLVGSKEKMSKTFAKCFKKGDEYSGKGWSQFIEWSRLIDKANGFVDERGNAKVQANFAFKLSDEQRGSPFYDPASFNSDCVLLVQKQRVYVNKGLLSVHSFYFDKLFNSDFKEKNQDEIEIGDDVTAFEFTQLLEAIYPFLKHEINVGNVEGLLRMVDRFQMDIVTQRCEVFLKGCATIPLEKKLILAQNCRFTDLLKSCAAQYKTLEDIKELKKTEEYALLTPETTCLIFDMI